MDNYCDAMNAHSTHHVEVHTLRSTTSYGRRGDAPSSSPTAFAER